MANKSKRKNSEPVTCVNLLKRASSIFGKVNKSGTNRADRDSYSPSVFSLKHFSSFLFQPGGQYPYDTPASLFRTRKSLRPTRHIGSEVDRTERGVQGGEAGHFLTEAWAVMYVGRDMGHFVEEDAFPFGERESLQ